MEKILATHECEEQKREPQLKDYPAEWPVFEIINREATEHEPGGWCISIEEAEIAPVINFCPFCGVKLD